MKPDIHNWLTPNQQKAAILAMIVLFSTGILLQLSSLFFFSLPKITKNMDVKIESHSDNSIESLLKVSLFGVYESTDLNSDDVTKSPLNVTVVGILLGNSMRDSQVIIRSEDGVEKNYSVGDALLGGATIKKIAPAGIVVLRHGRLERLSLPKNDLLFDDKPQPLIEEQE
jgi:general secretion pathway protein C